jgi:hypothetical protein
MSFRTFFLLSATSVVLSACAQGGTEHGQSASNGRIGVMTTPSAGPQYRENVRSLDGPQSVDLVVGNTVEGHYTDTPGRFLDYFAPDGRFVSLEPDGAVHQGRWKARYTEFCIEYDDHPHLKHQRCFSFFESSGRYSSFRPGNAGFYDIDSITAGNVKNLPLE